MIAGCFHQGSGLGDQLFRYVTVRTLAEQKGYEWGMVSPLNFKGSSFMNLNIPQFTGENPTVWNETDLRIDGIDRRSYDPEINFVEDNTVLDGVFEDNKYWGHNLDNISNWLAVEPLEVPFSTAIVGFRGGEYYADPNLGLPEQYYREAIAKLFLGRGIEKAEVHTDDPTLAHTIFDKMNFEIIDNRPISHSKHTNMGFNWRSARYAKYAIIPNSAFFILPRLLKHHEDPKAVTIAPRYWARRNTKVWARPACYYKQFQYV